MEHKQNLITFTRCQLKKIPRLLFLPQFVSPAQGSPVAQMLWLSAVFMATTFAVFAGYGVFAATVRDHVTRRPRVMTWLRRTFAVSYVALAARMAAASR